ncbi:uncharacterized protein JCM6883_007549 [Sporobolomyces salmoneus]|uniref:uncharacterized protein n=1 Tax=Sporobolomyces salmoneus TaxID=183962 RepID=UPI00317C5F93
MESEVEKTGRSTQPDSAEPRIPEASMMSDNEEGDEEGGDEDAEDNEVTPTDDANLANPSESGSNHKEKETRPKRHKEKGLAGFLPEIEILWEVFTENRANGQVMNHQAFSDRMQPYWDEKRRPGWMRDVSSTRGRLRRMKELETAGHEKKKKKKKSKAVASSTADPSADASTTASSKPTRPLQTGFVPPHPPQSSDMKHSHDVASLPDPKHHLVSPVESETAPSTTQSRVPPWRQSFDYPSSPEVVTEAASPSKRRCLVSTVDPSSKSSDKDQPFSNTITESDRSPSILESGIVIDEEAARKGLEMLERFKSRWEELDREWDGVVSLRP